METLSKYEHRKVRKVLVERKRRDRIERCLEQLKTLIFGIQQQQQQQLQQEQQQQQLSSTCSNAWIDAKLEKAELLELTVEQVHRFRRDASSQMSFGFLTCMREVQQFLQNETGSDTNMHTQLFRRLHRSVVKLDQGHDFDGQGNGLECRNKGRDQGHGFEGNLSHRQTKFAFEGVEQYQGYSPVLGQLEEEHYSIQGCDSISMQTRNDSVTAGKLKHHIASQNSSSSSGRHFRLCRGQPYISPFIVNSLFPRSGITSTNSFETQASLSCLRTSSSSLQPEVVEKSTFRCNEISSTTASGHVVTEIDASAIAGNYNKTLPVNLPRHDGSDVATMKDDVWRPW